MPSCSQRTKASLLCNCFFPLLSLCNYDLALTVCVYLRPFENARQLCNYDSSLTVYYCYHLKPACLHVTFTICAAMQALLCQSAATTVPPSLSVLRSRYLYLPTVQEHVNQAAWQFLFSLAVWPCLSCFLHDFCRPLSLRRHSWGSLAEVHGRRQQGSQAKIAGNLGLLATSGGKVRT